MAAAKGKKREKKAGPKEDRGKGRNQKDICFIIMPFGEEFDVIYSKVYFPAIKAVGLEPRRADDLYRPSAIVNDIWTLAKKAKIVLADLTGRNANVFYELGLVHALAKPAILVTASIDEVPFDLRALRVIEYESGDPEWGVILKTKIQKAIKEILQSPVQSVLPTFIKVKRTPPSTSLTPQDKEILKISQGLEELRREVHKGSGPSFVVPTSGFLSAIPNLPRLSPSFGFGKLPTSPPIPPPSLPDIPPTMLPTPFTTTGGKKTD